MITVLSAGRDSPAELRSRLALDESGQRKLLRTARPGIGEMIVLCTCHRTELYVTADSSDVEVIHAVASLLPLQPTDHHDLRVLQGLEAVEHIFRVACGLDSLVIGEAQVLGQVRRALVASREEEAVGPVLTRVFDHALELGRRVRSSGPLGGIDASIGRVAAEHLSHRFGGLSGRKGVVVGSGEAAIDAASALSQAGASLVVLSRTEANAASLAGRFDARSGPVESLSAELAAADFAVVAVSGGTVVREAHLGGREHGRPLVVVDLSVPAAVDLRPSDDVDVRSLEDLPGPRGPEVADAIIEAEAMVRKEVAALGRWADTRDSGETIAQLRARGDAIWRAEVQRALTGLELTPEQEELVSRMASRIAAKLMHGPSVALREGDDATRAIVRMLFDLEA